MIYPENIREAFRTVALAAMELREPPAAPWERRTVYRCWDPQGEVEPFDVNADWEENDR